MITSNRIFIFLSVVFAVGLIVSVGYNIRQHKLVNETSAERPLQMKVPKKVVDGNGNTHYERQENVVSPQAAEIMHGKLLDSISKLNGINAKNISALAHYVISKKDSLRGRAEVPQVIHDTVRIPFYLSGKNIQVEGEIKGKEATGIATVKLNLQRLNYWKRDWFLGSPRFYERLSSQDSTVRIDSVADIRIREAEQGRWSIGAFAGYDIVNMRPAAGVSINFDLLRFKKRKKK